MKLMGLQQSYSNRRANSFRSGQVTDESSQQKQSSSSFWLILHAFSCIVSLVLGFRFSRIIFFLLLSSPSSPNLSIFPNLTRSPPASRVVVGRHGIRIRPWPHPDPSEVMLAHRIIRTVQEQQRIQYGVRSPRTLIAITPTYLRTFQTLHLTGLIHSLMNSPYPVIWIVVESGGPTNETALLLSKSRLRVKHLGFHGNMPPTWDARHSLEASMRLHALRVVREEMLDGIVLFADESNMHSLELFDEIQKVEWIGAVSIGILAHSGSGDESLLDKSEGEIDTPIPIQGPACNSSDKLAGWHIFNSVPYNRKSAKYIDDRAVVLPQKFEWAGFVLNSRLLWKDAENKPDWVKDLDSFSGIGEGLESPLSLIKDHSVVEPLGSCGRKVLLWWLRVEARSDSKFPSGWIIDPPLEITVPAKQTPWPDAPPELPSNEKMSTTNEHVEKRAGRTRLPRSKRPSRTRRKREPKTSNPHDPVKHPTE